MVTFFFRSVGALNSVTVIKCAFRASSCFPPPWLITYAWKKLYLILSVISVAEIFWIGTPFFLFGADRNTKRRANDGWKAVERTNGYQVDKWMDVRGDKRTDERWLLLVGWQGGWEREEAIREARKQERKKRWWLRYSGAVLMLETRRQEIPGEKKSLFQPLHCLPLYSLGSERVSVPHYYPQQTICQQKVFVSITSFASILIFRKRTCVYSSLLPTADHGFTKKKVFVSTIWIASSLLTCLSFPFCYLQQTGPFFSSTSKSNFSYVCFILSSWSYSSNQFPLNPQWFMIISMKCKNLNQSKPVPNGTGLLGWITTITLTCFNRWDKCKLAQLKVRIL